MGQAIRGGGRRTRARVLGAALVALVALAPIATGLAYADSRATEATVGPTGTIAAAAPGHRLELHAAPGGPTVHALGARTAFGSRTRLAVLGRRGGWLAVSSEALGNTRRAWIKRSPAVRLYRTPYTVLVSVHARRLELRAGSRTLLRAVVAVGRPDSPTPTGRFGITDKFAGARFGHAYGCCVLVLSAVQTHLPRGWTGGNRLALHGTSAPASLGRASSAGCVRLDDRPLRALMRRLPLGAPVVIRR